MQWLVRKHEIEEILMRHKDKLVYWPLWGEDSGQDLASQNSIDRFQQLSCLNLSCLHRAHY